MLSGRALALVILASSLVKALIARMRGERTGLALFHENYDGNGVPTFNTDRAATLASLDRFKRLATNLKATVIIQHDQRDVSKLPAFPESAK